MEHDSPSPPQATPPPLEPRSRAGALAEGSLFGGRYRIVRCIAVGGMGAIYEVVHAETGRRRALKVMHPHLFQSEEMRERFKREARVSAEVDSEYIVDVSDAGVDEGSRTPFLVMELLQGEELGDRLNRLGHLPPIEAVTYLHQIALALDKTHAKSIVHRDLKPENVFLTVREDGSPRVKILDFGVAKVVREGTTGAGATRSLGTPLYMAPEQFRTSAKLTPQADLYALGMMAFALLVGQPYWTPEANAAADVIAFAMTVIRGPQESAVARAAARGVGLPAAFDAWFARATALNAADRFSRASAAIQALAEVLGVPLPVSAQVLPSPAMPTTVRQGPLTLAVPAAASPVPASAVSPTPVVSGPGTPAGADRVSTSSGFALGALASQPPPRSRRPAILVTTLLVGAAVLGIGGWLALRAVVSPPADAAAPRGSIITATSKEAAGTVTVPPEPSVQPEAPSPTETASAPPTAAPTARPATTPRAAPTALLSARPTGSATPKPPLTTPPATTPTAEPPAKPAALPLIGRD